MDVIWAPNDPTAPADRAYRGPAKAVRCPDLESRSHSEVHCRLPPLPQTMTTAASVAPSWLKSARSGPDKRRIEKYPAAPGFAPVLPLPPVSRTAGMLGSHMPAGSVPFATWFFVNPTRTRLALAAVATEDRCPDKAIIPRTSKARLRPARTRFTQFHESGTRPSFCEHCRDYQVLDESDQSASWEFTVYHHWPAQNGGLMAGPLFG